LISESIISPLDDDHQRDLRQREVFDESDLLRLEMRPEETPATTPTQ
jgi:hypothetical protein